MLPQPAIRTTIHPDAFRRPISVRSARPAARYQADGTAEHAPLAPPGSELPSEEAFGLPQLGDAAQAMMPDVHMALSKLNQNLDGLQVTIARANDLLNDRNRASIGSSLRRLSPTLPLMSAAWAIRESSV